MQKHSFRFPAVLAAVVIVICVALGIITNKTAEISAQTTKLTTLYRVQPKASKESVFTLIKPTEHANVFIDKANTPNPSRTISGHQLDSAQLARRLDFTQKLKELKSEVQRRGTVRVIVKVYTDFQPEGHIKDETALQAQRTMIEKSQNSLLAKLRYEPSSLKKFKDIPYVALSTDSTGLTQLEESPMVLDVSQDVPMKLAANENITLIGAQKAWAGGYTGTGQTIAILDTGIDKTNSAYLVGKVVSEACYSTTDTTNGYSSTCPASLPSPSTAPGSGVNCNITGVGCEHGTEVAGIAAGSTGVAIGANIISINVATYANNDTFPGTLIALSSDVITALERVKDLQTSGYYTIAAASISLSSDNINTYTNNCDELVPGFTDAINNLRSVGVATIVASGNDGKIDALGFPACISSAISVGATNAGDQASGTIADTIWNDSNVSPLLNLLAPGNLIVAPVPGGGTNAVNGTSLASAHVAGGWTLLRKNYPFGDTTWFNDTLPTGAILNDEGWNWITSNPTPFVSTKAHQSVATELGTHYFTSATATLQLGVGDSIYTWAYLDPANMPSEIMLEWNDGTSWEHRAYWGANNIGRGTDGQSSRMRIGDLPHGGGWVYLEATASAVGLEGKTVNGMAFTQYGGRVTWDHTGKSTNPVQYILSILRQSGKNILDNRPGGISTVPRIQIDSALGVNVPDGRWMGEYFNNTSLSGNPVNSQPIDDGDVMLPIDKNYAGGAPISGINNQYYSIRWIGAHSLVDGDYRFSVTADNGVKLYIDDMNTPKLDQWANQGSPTSYNFDTHLTSGVHLIKLEYSHTTAVNAQVRLTWGLNSPSCLQTPQGNNWKGEYFNNQNLSGSSVMMLDDSVNPLNKNGANSINDSLYFNWGGVSPNPNLSSSCQVPVLGNNFSIKWTRTAAFPINGYIQFNIDAEVGVRLYIDDMNNPVFSTWDQTTGTRTYNQTVTPTTHTIKLESQQLNGNTRARLSWNPITLSAPTSLIAKAVSTSGIDLTWTNNTNLSNQIIIERSSDGGNSFPTIYTVGGNVTSYSDTSGLAPATTYTYRIKARNAGGDSSYSNINSTTTLRPIPTAPTNLVATASTSSLQIGLSWNNGSNYADGFRIYRNGSKIITVSANQTSYTDLSNLAGGTSYTYQITAYNTTGESGYSISSNVTTIPTAPYNLSATAVSPSEVSLTWNQNDNKNGFRIYRNGSKVAEVGANQYSYTDSGLAANTTYTYQITAYNTTGESSYSNSSSATTKPSCTYSVSPTSITVDPSGGGYSVTITTNSWCSWTVSRNVSWLDVSGGGTGSGSATINVSSSSGDYERNGSAFIAGIEVSVDQTAGVTPLRKKVINKTSSIQNQNR